MRRWMVLGSAVLLSLLRPLCLGGQESPRQSPLARLRIELSQRPGAAKLGPQVAERILHLSKKYEADGITPALILGVIEVESNFDPNAVSRGRVDSFGLMQVTPATAAPYLRSMGLPADEATILNPMHNLDIGVRHLAELHRQYQKEGLEERSFALTAMSYNCGEGFVRRRLVAGGNLPLKYVTKVEQATRRWYNRGF